MATLVTLVLCLGLDAGAYHAALGVRRGQPRRRAALVAAAAGLGCLVAGILGTTLAMVSSFDALAGLPPEVKATTLSQGISGAMGATVAGMIGSVAAGGAVVLATLGPGAPPDAEGPATPDP